MNENKIIVDLIDNFFIKENAQIKGLIHKNDKRNDDFNALKDLVGSRYSVRNYSNKKVPYQLIEKSLGIANSLPTACNRQACSLIIIENKDIRETILNLQQGNQGFTAPMLAAIAVDKNAFTQDNEFFHIVAAMNESIHVNI